MANTLIEILLLAACVYAIFQAGSAYTIWRIQQDLIALENGELDFDDPLKVESSGEFLNIVKENGIFYAYGENNRFITQGNNLHDLFSSIKEGFPNTTWLINHKESSTLSREEQDSILPILTDLFAKQEQQHDKL